MWCLASRGKATGVSAAKAATSKSAAASGPTVVPPDGDATPADCEVRVSRIEPGIDQYRVGTVLFAPFFFSVAQLERIVSPEGPLFEFLLRFLKGGDVIFLLM
jgi:hypothetical protein